MFNYVIIPDSSCDLNASLRERYGIPDYLRGIVTFPDGRSQKADLDWVTTTPEAFFNSMKDKKHLVKTSTASIEEACELFSVYLDKGLDVLSVSLSSALSGTYNVCVQAAKQLAVKYPERKIICVDSLRYSTSLSLLIAMASDLRTQGKSIDEVAGWMNLNKNRIHQIGCMDDLFFLCSSGRLSNFKAFFGTLVGINPMADFNRAGLSEVLVKSKGKAMAFSVAVDYMKRTGDNLSERTVFIAHSNRKEQALNYKALIEKEIHPKEIILNDVGMSCGASIGPGLIAAFYYGTEISEDSVYEKELAKEIMQAYKN